MNATIAEIGWLVPAEFIEASSGEVSQEMKFFVYPKRDRPLIWLQAADLLLEAIVKNGDFRDGLKVHMNRDKASKRFLLVSFLEELSNRPTYFETEDWRCVRLES
jgi:hypothetical protein